MASPTNTYTLLRGGHSLIVDGARRYYKAGTDKDKMQLTKEQAKSLGDRVQLAPSISQVSDSSQSTKPDPAAVSEWSNSLSSMSAAEAIDAISGLEDVEELNFAIQGEKQGKNRSSVVKAAEERLTVIQAE